MKIWTSEHTFEHSWGTVIEAALRKYPNPITPGVTGVDVLDRQIDERTGILKTHRLMCTAWGIPNWAASIFGVDPICYVSEHSEVDAKKKLMKLQSTNLTFCNIVRIDEHLSYTEHPTDKTKTLMKQEAIVTVRGLPLTDYMENIVTTNYNNNAKKGREGVEWVIKKLKDEATELKAEAQLCVDNLLPKMKTL